MTDDPDRIPPYTTLENLRDRMIVLEAAVQDARRHARNNGIALGILLVIVLFFKN